MDIPVSVLFAACFIQVFSGKSGNAKGSPILQVDLDV